MTQLFIDGQEVVLPEDFSCKSISENPFFTKSGEYTLNITISLDNPFNSKIYKHIHRINSLARFEKRSAILVSDNEVIIKGEEVILNYSNKDVEIQIVAGNSSLNYLIGSDRKLRDLNLGSAVIDKTKIVSNLTKNYPDVDYQLLPFYDPDNEFFGNWYTWISDPVLGRKLIYAYDGEFKARLVPGSNERYKYENYRPQPYFCAIIRKIFQSFGYTLSNSIENHPIFKYSYIVHAYDTLDFAKMLPDWTVTQFMDELENLFDCTVIVDNNSMGAKIVFNHDFYKTSIENSITMLNDYEVQVEETDEKMQYEKNISYNLPGTTYYAYQNLPLSLVNSLNVINGGYENDKVCIQEIANWIKNRTPDAVRADIRSIYKSSSLEFIEYIENDYVYAKAVNDYKPLKNNDSDSDDIQLNIIPAEFHNYYWQGYTNSTPWYLLLQLPVAKCLEQPLMINEVDNIVINPLVQDIIEGESSTETKRNYSQLSIAFYNSNYSVAFNSGDPVPISDYSYPMSFIRSISERVELTASRHFHFFNSYNGKYVNPLSLKFLQDEIYSKNEKIDRSKIYKLRFLNPGKKLDPKEIFVIGNRKFYCKKIERNVTMDGFDEIIEGEFYAEKD